MCGGSEAMGEKMFDKALIGQNACLGKAIHALAYFNHDRVIMHQ